MQFSTTDGPYCQSPGMKAARARWKYELMAIRSTLTGCICGGLHTAMECMGVFSSFSRSRYNDYQYLVGV